MQHGVHILLNLVEGALNISDVNSGIIYLMILKPLTPESASKVKGQRAPEDIRCLLYTSPSPRD